MTFLSKIGKILLGISEAAIGIMPVLQPLLGSKGNSTIVTAENDLTAIGTLAIQIETALQGQSGPAKLQALIALVGPIIKTSQLVSGQTIANPTLFQTGVNEVSQGVVDILNSIHEGAADAAVKNN